MYCDNIKKYTETAIVNKGGMNMNRNVNFKDNLVFIEELINCYIDKTIHCSAAKSFLQQNVIKMAKNYNI